MTKRTKKIMRMQRRCRVERISKFITWLLVCIVLTVGAVFEINGYYVAIISTTIWFLVPDITAYVLELFFHIEHKIDAYR